MLTLSERIRNARKQVGLTQAEMALALGVSKSTYCRWEQDAQPNLSVKRIQQLADITGKQPAWFFEAAA